MCYPLQWKWDYDVLQIFQLYKIIHSLHQKKYEHKLYLPTFSYPNIEGTPDHDHSIKIFSNSRVVKYERIIMNHSPSTINAESDQVVTCETTHKQTINVPTIN